MRETVLIVRAGALGDTILTLPLLETIRAKHKNAWVTFLGNRPYRDLVPPGIEFQAIDDPRWLWLFGASGEERDGRPPAYGYAYVILTQPQEVIRNLREAGTAHIAHASPRPPMGKHVVEHIHDGFGLPVPRREPALLRMAPRKKQELIWVHPGSGGWRKCAPLETFFCVVEQLRRETGWPVVVTAGEEDRFLKSRADWVRLVEAPGTELMEERPLKEICARLGQAGLYVGNDSGISHLAAALGVPSVVFFTVTDPCQWAPWVPVDHLRVVKPGEWWRREVEEALLALGLGAVAPGKECTDQENTLKSNRLV